MSQIDSYPTEPEFTIKAVQHRTGITTAQPVQPETRCVLILYRNALGLVEHSQQGCQRIGAVVRVHVPPRALGQDVDFRHLVKR